jgi:hypothetical protein
MASAMSFVFVPTSAAQNVIEDSKKPTPRLKDGRPDLNGFYNSRHYQGDPVLEDGGHVLTKTDNGSAFFSYGGANSQGNGVNLEQRGDPKAEANQPSYKPEYMARVKEIADKAYGTTSPHDPQMECKPYGLPRGAMSGGGGSAMQIVQNDKYIAMLYEDRPGPYYRIIYMDGRQHPKDYDSSFFGHSIGHWEGDTLVVDVVGLNDETWLGGGFIGPKYALFHSDQEHVVERWTRTGDVLTYEATVEDPVMFTKPWVITPRRIGIGAPGDYMQPQMCVALSKSHLVEQSETDKYVCGWCVKDIDAIYGEGALATQEKEAKEVKKK